MGFAKRQVDDEFTALAFDTGHGNLAAMQLHQLFGQCQSDSGPRLSTRVLVAVAIEIIEEMRQRFFRNPHAGVADGNLKFSGSWQ